ncbi:MAG: acyl-CoA dehydrogenase [Cytophagales bacterium]|nr:acyl-CoA dehydrogenase [Cytophagales bacterium]
MSDYLTGIKEFLNSEVIPLEQENLPYSELLVKLIDLRDQVKSAGWWLPQLPGEVGGMGLSLEQFGPISEILGGCPYGHFVFNCQAPDAGNMEILIEHGTPEQKEKYLQPLLKGDIRSCFAMTEPDTAGSNPILLATTATADGDDYVINGHKWFASSADGAEFAIVMLQTDPENENVHQRASQIIVPMNIPGIEFVRNIPIMGVAGEGYFSHGELKFNNVRVPKSSILGSEGAGFSIAQDRLGPGRIHHCMRWIGICERAFGMMCERAMSREISPGKSLATKQTIQNWIAESRAEINASRLMVLDAANRIDTVGAHKAKVEISTIKFFVSNVLMNVLDRAIQVHGALGITSDTLLSHWYTHERGARIYDGADEVHKSNVAREILKSY